MTAMYSPAASAAPTFIAVCLPPLGLARRRTGKRASRAIASTTCAVSSVEPSSTTSHSKPSRRVCAWRLAKRRGSVPARLYVGVMTVMRTR
jgi:hypothetical protein